MLRKPVLDTFYSQPAGSVVVAVQCMRTPDASDAVLAYGATHHPEKYRAVMALLSESATVASAVFGTPVDQEVNA